MKALLLSITAGQGHHATASAVRKRLEFYGVQCETLDVYEYAAPILKELVARGYLILTAHAPKVEATFYTLAENRSKVEDRASMMQIMNNVLAKKLIQYLEDYKPDVIICTHVFASGIVNSLKAKKVTNALHIGIVTDFTLHPFWEDLKHIDYIITASELLEYAARQRGVESAKLLPLGIPIDTKFCKGKDRKAAREALGLHPDQPAILIMSGSMGFGKMDKAIAQLDALNHDFQAMVVCGSNKAMENKIKKIKTNHDFRVYGYVDTVEQMMDAADCIVTKPGGLTTSEALQKDLPVIMVNPIPGQEERNVDFLLNTGMAMYATPTYPVDEVLNNALTDPELLLRIQENIKRLGKKNATDRLCAFVMEEVKKRG